MANTPRERADFTFSEYSKDDRSYRKFASRARPEFPRHVDLTEDDPYYERLDRWAFDWMKELGLFGEDDGEIVLDVTGSGLGSSTTAGTASGPLGVGIDLAKVKRVKFGGIHIHEFIFVGALFREPEELPVDVRRVAVRFKKIVSPYEHHHLLLTRSFKDRLVQALGHALPAPRVSDERFVREP